MADFTLLAMYAMASYSMFQHDVGTSLVADVPEWPASLLAADPSALEQYRTGLEEKVGNLAEEREVDCEGWTPWWWCGGKTRGGYAKFWMFRGCALGAGHPPCQRSHKRIETEADMLRVVERRAAGAAGFASAAFLSALFRTCAGAVNATLGVEPVGYHLHLLTSDVSPTTRPPVSPVWAYVSLLHFQVVYLYHLSAALPWTLQAHAPLDPAVADTAALLLPFAHWLLLLLFALPYLATDPRRHLLISAVHVFLAQRTCWAFALVAAALAVQKLAIRRPADL